LPAAVPGNRADAGPCTIGRPGIGSVRIGPPQ